LNTEALCGYLVVEEFSAVGSRRVMDAIDQRERHVISVCKVF
jgi:hypothetical protein